MFGINALKNEVRDLRRELDKKSFNMADYERVKSENSLICQEIQTLKTQVRTQTEADLYLECEKIKDKIIHGAKKEDIELTYRNNLMNALAQQGAPQYNSYSGLLGALGLSSSIPGWSYGHR